MTTKVDSGRKHTTAPIKFVDRKDIRLRQKQSAAEREDGDEVLPHDS